MLYYLPDARDVVDSTYDFGRESRSPDRIRRDDLYAHEVYDEPPYDGMLVSHALVEGSKSKYTVAERRRLYRSGFREFARVPADTKVMGDCGAFSYLKEHEPPVSPQDVANFYGRIGADFGLAVDHIVGQFATAEPLFVEPEARRRFELTLDLATDFWRHSQGLGFEPIGAVQGWSPSSMAAAATKLQAMGYRYLAIGGLVRRKDTEITAILQALDSVRLPQTRLHLLGVARPGTVSEWTTYGVASIDSTSPLRRAWTDARHNYWLADKSYSAIRVPASDSPRVARRIGAGELDGDRLRHAEGLALNSLARFDMEPSARNLRTTLACL
ncbi:MAG: tRNA-guanine transglycosylase DpdA, partial [Gammaproteobacteria bacterium]